MVLPIYASVEKLDFRLVEAAYDLYADRWTVLRRILLPLAAPGIVAGCILVFIPSLGAFIAPDLLGGGKQPDDRQHDRAAVRLLAQLAVRRRRRRDPDGMVLLALTPLRAAPR